MPNSAFTSRAGPMGAAGATGPTGSAGPTGPAGVTEGWPMTYPPSGNVIVLPVLAGVGSSQTLLSVDQTVYYLPFLITATKTLTAIAARVTTAGSVGSVTRMGIFADNAGVPGSVLLDAGTVASTSSSATISIGSLSLSLAPGLYWAGICSQGAPATKPTFLANNASGIETLGVVSVADFVANFRSVIGRTQTGVSGSFATAASTGNILSTNGSTPWIFLTF
jgi:hypothetical protein